jgi:hypothetical protein
MPITHKIKQAVKLKFKQYLGLTQYRNEHWVDKTIAGLILTCAAMATTIYLIHLSHYRLLHLECFFTALTRS